MTKRQTPKLCSKSLHPMIGTNVRRSVRSGSTSVRVQCKACERIREYKRKAAKDDGRVGEFGRLAMKGRTPHRYIYPDDYEPPALKPRPLHKQALLIRMADPDIKRYHMERAASAMRVRSRDNERAAEWGGHARGFPSFREFASAPSRDFDVQPETS